MRNLIVMSSSDSEKTHPEQGYFSEDPLSSASSSIRHSDVLLDEEEEIRTKSPPKPSINMYFVGFYFLVYACTKPEKKSL